MSVNPCETCRGKRLRPEILAVTIGGKNIAELCELSIRDAIDFVEGLTLSEKEGLIAHQIIKEIRARLQFLIDVGLDYLTLSRSSGTLSGENLKESVWRHRLDPVWLAYCIFWMNRVLGFIKKTMRNCLQHCVI